MNSWMHGSTIYIDPNVAHTGHASVTRINNYLTARSHGILLERLMCHVACIIPTGIVYLDTGAPTQVRKWGIIMASAASLKIFFARVGDNPPRNRKTNNAGIKVEDRSPSSPRCRRLCLDTPRTQNHATLPAAGPVMAVYITRGPWPHCFTQLDAPLSRMLHRRSFSKLFIIISHLMSLVGMPVWRCKNNALVHLGFTLYSPGEGLKNMNSTAVKFTKM
jgi:hypothetical protein